MPHLTRLPRASTQFGPRLWLTDLAALALLALGLVSTQHHAFHLAAPWREDPYISVLDSAMVFAPALALVGHLRTLLHRSPGAGLAGQVRRTCLVVCALVLASCVMNWIAVGVHADSGRTTELLIAGLAVVSVLALVALALALTLRPEPDAETGPQRDWVGDVAELVDRFAGGTLGGHAARFRDWTRQRTGLAIALVAALIAVGLVVPLAVGERWTDPVLIGFVLAFAFATNLGYLLLINRLLTVIAPRPPRGGVRREHALIGLAFGADIAFSFRDQFMAVLGRPSVETVGALILITAIGAVLGTGVGAATP